MVTSPFVTRHIVGSHFRKIKVPKMVWTLVWIPFFICSVQSSSPGFIISKEIQIFMRSTPKCRFYGTNFENRMTTNLDLRNINLEQARSRARPRFVMTLFSGIDLQNFNLPAIFGKEKMHSTEQVDGADTPDENSYYDSDCDWEYKYCETRVS